MNVHTGFSPGESLESSVQTSSGSFTPAVQPTKVRKMVAATEAKVRHSKAHSRAMVAIPKNDDDVESVASSAVVSVASSRRSDLLHAKIVLQRKRELAEARLEEAAIDEELAKSSRASAGQKSEVASEIDPEEDSVNPFAGAFAGGEKRSELLDFNISRLQESIGGVKFEREVQTQPTEEEIARREPELSSPLLAASSQGHLAEEPPPEPVTIGEVIFDSFAQNLAELPEVAPLPRFEAVVPNWITARRALAAASPIEVKDSQAGASVVPVASFAPAEFQISEQLMEIPEEDVLPNGSSSHDFIMLEPDAIQQTVNIQVQQSVDVVQVAQLVQPVVVVPNEQVLLAQAHNMNMQNQIQILAAQLASMQAGQERDKEAARVERALAYQQGVDHAENLASIHAASLPERASEFASTQAGAAHFNIGSDKSDYSSALSAARLSSAQGNLAVAPSGPLSFGPSSVVAPSFVPSVVGETLPRISGGTITIVPKAASVKPEKASSSSYADYGPAGAAVSVADGDGDKGKKDKKDKDAKKDKKEKKEKKEEPKKEKKVKKEKKPPTPPESSDDEGSSSDSGSSDSKSSVSSSDSVLGKLGKTKYKIDEAFKFNSMPTVATQVRAWKNSVYSTVNSASGRPDDKALVWVMKVEAEGVEAVKRAKFSASGIRFAVLDKRIASKLISICTGELGRVISQAVEDAQNESPTRSLKGREVLWMILDAFATSKFGQAMFNLCDLQEVRLVNFQLETFWYTWVHILTGMKRKPCEEDKEILFYKQIKDHKGLAEDISHYNRLEEGSGGDRSYAFLDESVARFLRITKQAKSRAELSKGLSGAGGKVPALTGPEKKDKIIKTKREKLIQKGQKGRRQGC